MKAIGMFAIESILMIALAVPAIPQHTDSHDDKATGSYDWAELETSMERMHVEWNSHRKAWKFLVHRREDS